MNDYETKKQARIDRYRDKADKARAESENLYKQSSDMLSAIPPGQPLFPVKGYDNISIRAEAALGQFIIKKTYMGYPFLVNAIREAVTALPDRLTTPELCELVAANEEADPAVVSRGLNRMVNSIWNSTRNLPVYSQIVGQEVATRPLPIEFIYAMTNYLIRQQS